jgi:hypothetical protein
MRKKVIKLFLFVDDMIIYVENRNVYCSTIHNSQVMETAKMPAPPLTNGLRKCSIYIQRNFMQP